MPPAPLRVPPAPLHVPPARLCSKPSRDPGHPRPCTGGGARAEEGAVDGGRGAGAARRRRVTRHRQVGQDPARMRRHLRTSAHQREPQGQVCWTPRCSQAAHRTSRAPRRRYAPRRAPPPRRRLQVAQPEQGGVTRTRRRAGGARAELRRSSGGAQAELRRSSGGAQAELGRSSGGDRAELGPVETLHAALGWSSGGGAHRVRSPCQEECRLYRERGGRRASWCDVMSSALIPSASHDRDRQQHVVCKVCKVELQCRVLSPSVCERGEITSLSGVGVNRLTDDTRQI